MAVRFDSSADRLLRTTGLLDYNSTYTWMLWVYPVTVTAGTWYSIGSHNNDSFNNCDELEIVDSSPSKFCITVQHGGTWLGDFNGTTTPVAGTWYHLAVVRESATTIKLYVNGSLEATGSVGNVTGRTAPSRMELGAFGSGNANPFDGRVAGIKAWSAALTLAEVNQEMYTLTPFRATEVYLWSPCFPTVGERGKDYSGFTRDWTKVGGLTDEDPPPVGYGGSSIFLPFFAGGTTYNASLSGTLTGAGALAKLGAKPLAGAVTSAGALAKQDQKPFAGSVASGGALAKQGQKGLSGSVTSAGALTDAVGKALAGTISSAGALAGAIAKSLSGTLAAVGGLAQQLAKPLTGTLTSSGALSNVKAVLATFSGTLTGAGALTRQAQKGLSGTVTSAGALSDAIGKSLSGTLATVGSLAQHLAKPLTGTLTPSGVLSHVKVVLATFSGTLNGAGALTRQAQKGLSGTVTSAGSVAKAITYALTGSLTPAGALAKQFASTFMGTLASAGALTAVSLGVSAKVALTLAARVLTWTLHSRDASLTVNPRDTDFTIIDRTD